MSRIREQSRWRNRRRYDAGPAVLEGEVLDDLMADAITLIMYRVAARLRREHPEEQFVICDGALAYPPEIEDKRRIRDL